MNNFELNSTLQMIKVTNIILVILVLYLLYKEFTRKESFTANDDVRDAVNQIYTADIEALRNLSGMAAKLMGNNNLTFPGILTVTNNIVGSKDLTISGNITANKDLTISGNITANSITIGDYILMLSPATNSTLATNSLSILHKPTSQFIWGLQKDGHEWTGYGSWTPTQTDLNNINNTLNTKWTIGSNSITIGQGSTHCSDQKGWTIQKDGPSLTFYQPGCGAGGYYKWNPV